MYGRARPERARFGRLARAAGDEADCLVPPGERRCAVAGPGAAVPHPAHRAGARRVSTPRPRTAQDLSRRLPAPPPPILPRLAGVLRPLAVPRRGAEPGATISGGTRRRWPRQGIRSEERRV